MPNRQWFFASGNTQQGPYSEDQLRDFIALAMVRAFAPVLAASGGGA